MRRRCFTLIEMLSTVSALVIVLGLMVSLARHVRSRESGALSRQVLASLDDLLQRDPALEKLLEGVPPLVRAGAAAEEAEYQRAALRNNRELVRILKESGDGSFFRQVPVALYDVSTLRDAWGTPVVYMKPGAQNIGISPMGRYFFVSAGPDRQFGTVLDNLYSHEPAWSR
jgi:hypothetical protein